MYQLKTIGTYAVDHISLDAYDCGNRENEWRKLNTKAVKMPASRF
jgi:hypothetical protein